MSADLAAQCVDPVVGLTPPLVGMIALIVMAIPDTVIMMGEDMPVTLVESAKAFMDVSRDWLFGIFCVALSPSRDIYWEFRAAGGLLFAWA